MTPAPEVVRPAAGRTDAADAANDSITSLPPGRQDDESATRPSRFSQSASGGSLYLLYEGAISSRGREQCVEICLGQVSSDLETSERVGGARRHKAASILCEDHLEAQ